MSNNSDMTRDGLEHASPGSQATAGVNVPPGGGAPRPEPAQRRKRREEPEFRSYYDLPILNKPVWESPDIPGYFFLGGLAGTSAVIAAGAGLSGRRQLARVAKLAAAGGAHLSLLALVHDLGRSGRFLNMLRMFKLTSPMSVGSWILTGFAPAATWSAISDVTGWWAPTGAAATAGAAALGPAVAAYTAVLISDTAVPAWHDGHRLMPFVFCASAASAGAGWGLLAAPVTESTPLKGLAVGAGAAELALSKTMEKRMGIVEEAYHEGKAGRYMRAAGVLNVAGVLLVASSGRGRLRRALGGAALLAASAATRFGIFEAGINSAQDPKYTVVPQRERLEAREAERR